MSSPSTGLGRSNVNNSLVPLPPAHTAAASSAPSEHIARVAQQVWTESQTTQGAVAESLNSRQLTQRTLASMPIPPAFLEISDPSVKRKTMTGGTVHAGT